MSQFRQTIRQQMIRETLLGQMVYSKITLLTPEIEAFYRENIDRFTEPAEVELAEILFLTEGKDRNQVRSRAEEVLARLRSGASFEETVREYSDGPTASRGGVIGTFKKGSMAPELEAVAFTIPEGEISGIIEAEYGLQIIRVLKRDEDRRKPLEEVRGEIQQELYRRKAQPELQAFMEQLRAESFVYVAPKYREQFDVQDL